MPAPSTRDAQGRLLQTRSSLAEGLRAVGIVAGDVVCAHVSLSSLGFVCGAAQTVIGAFADALGDAGTLMMPAFSGEMSDPAIWRVPPVPEDWMEPIRSEMPAFDPCLTPTRMMGTVAELFRTYPGTMRSPHPHSSFAARGARAECLVGSHPLPVRFGPRSPLGKLAALDGKVLLLGAGSDRASFVYLAQYLAGVGAAIAKAVPVPRPDGRIAWTEVADFAVSNPLVSSGVSHLIDRGVARVGAIGDARAVILPVRESLAALLDWGWKTADVPHDVLREPVPLPARWEDWLQTESLGDA